MKWLKEIEGSVGVISIIGPYRSGKSWLLVCRECLLIQFVSGFSIYPFYRTASQNQLLRVLLGKTGQDTSSFVSPFKVGHTVQAETEEVRGL